MVILTPTTQEWRELRKENGTVDDEELPSSDSSDDDQPLQRTVSAGSEDLIPASSSIQPPPPDRPALYATRSVDFLEKETRHTPDPGSLAATPIKETTEPVFSSNIIAPSPTPLKSVEPKVVESSAEESPVSHRSKRRSLQEQDDVPDLAPDEEGDSSPNQDDAPPRFASIGRRDSLKIFRKPGDQQEGPKTKSKRELERERLFKMVDEELEESTEKSTYGIQKIGRGALSPSEPRIKDPFAIKVKEPSPKADTAPLPPVKTSPTSSINSHKSISPTQPMRPSPLNASPYNAANGLPTPTTPSPAESPALATELSESPLPSRPVLPAPENTGERLDVMRDYARALQSHHSSGLNLHQPTRKDIEPVVTASPPRSPRSPRVRDMTRQSLVAGRIVQPYAPTPGAALPERPGMFRQASSLQSFSPFRSPQLSAARAGSGLMPNLGRLDSTISLAPSTGVPSECGTPSSETAAGMGGHGISDYVIIKEAGKGAYGLVMRAKVKGPRGEPIGVSLLPSDLRLQLTCRTR
jgi:protein-serine/threonine kinase